MILGYPDRSLTTIQQALRQAQELDHPISLAHVTFLAAFVHQLRREPSRTQEFAKAVIDLAKDKEMAFYRGEGTFWHDWALAQQGQLAGGAEQLRRDLADHKAFGAEIFQPQMLAMLAEVLAAAGQVQQGLAVLAEALDLADSTGERCHEAELHRLRGELLLLAGADPLRQTEAAACFRQALEVARRQEAKSFELRAVMSLSRMYQAEGRREEARQVVEEVYGWFQEGFDTPDLREARAILQGGS